ncbi:MAG: glycosyltransferase family 4 protein [Caldilineaceae bacterium]
MSDVLLTVSGTIAPDITTQITQGARPQADYMAMAQRFNADLLDYTQAQQQGGRFGQWLEKMGGPNLLLAWCAFRRRHDYRVIFTDGEQVGIPFALLCKLGGRQGIRHLMIGHILSVGKKMALVDLFALQRYIDIFFVYSSWQKHFIEQRWQVPSERVIFTPFMVDSAFFSPKAVVAQPRRMICAVGLEFRDYPTLLAAVDGLDVEVVIAAASPWSKRADTTKAANLPANVTVRKFSQYELRQLYADSLFVVMPLYNVNFQAGVTAILEAMSMGKAVICSRTPGQTDVVVDQTTGLYVAPEDPQTLKNTIKVLLDNPQMAASMGVAGRQRVEQSMNLDCYTARLNHFVQQAIQQDGGYVYDEHWKKA